MINSLKLLFKMFYAPLGAIAEVRERAPLFAAAGIALVLQAAFQIFVQGSEFWRYVATPNAVFVVIRTLLSATQAIVLVGVVFALCVLLVANLFERRGSFRVVATQDYAATAATMLYAWAAATLIALVVFALLRVTGGEAVYVQGAIAQFQNPSPETRDMLAQMTQRGLILDSRSMTDPRSHSRNLAALILLAAFAAWATVAVREIFGARLIKSALIIIIAGIAAFFAMGIISVLPFFLLLFLFIALRGYFGDVMNSQRARTSFKQNLEAATLNPADASAHYNLGLIHLDRKELDKARERFARAVEIDTDENDAHYQLGRISRLQNDYTEAVQHFEQVVTRDDAHAQHEIWREIGATYLAANQPEDAREALERFLDNRAADPEGLYLLGRTLAKLGRTREATDLMRRCIEAVKSAPAYKYRTEKRWLNEAQSYLRANAQEVKG